MIDFTHKNLTALKVTKEQINQNLEEGLLDYHLFMDILIQLQMYMVDNKVNIPEYKSKVDTLITKTIFHCTTIKTIVQGQILKTKYQNKEFKIIDLPSLYVIIRAQLETYLIFEYLYGIPDKDEEIEFRYKIWLYSGLLSRKDIKPKNEIERNQKIDDDNLMLEIRHYLKSSEKFNKFSKALQRDILEKGKSRLPYNSWTSIMQDVGINEIFAKKLYGLLSHHAHSNSLGLINLSAMKLGYYKKHPETFNALWISKTILAKMIFRFKDMFNATKIKFNTFPSEHINLIEFYSKLLTTKPRI